jgi:hypothetical protein
MTEPITKERPILFKAEMVRAILDGRKTQTRRIVKGARHEGIGHCHWSGTGWAHLWPHGGCSCQSVACPYGAPGDRLWVREAWTRFPPDAPDGMGEAIYYRAEPGNLRDSATNTMEQNGVKWRPPIRMPRWASRITLEIVDVRVERLHSITEADAVAEGVGLSHRAISPYESEWSFWDYLGNAPCYGMARDSFASLWESINGPGSWDANPWVWAVQFRRLPNP